MSLSGICPLPSKCIPNITYSRRQIKSVLELLFDFRFVFNVMFAICFQKLLLTNVPHSLREFDVGNKDDNQKLS